MLCDDTRSAKIKIFKAKGQKHEFKRFLSPILAHRERVVKVWRRNSISELINFRDINEKLKSLIESLALQNQLRLELLLMNSLQGHSLNNDCESFPSRRRKLKLEVDYHYYMKMVMNYRPSSLYQVTNITVPKKKSCSDIRSLSQSLEKWSISNDNMAFSRNQKYFRDMQAHILKEKLILMNRPHLQRPGGNTRYYLSVVIKGVSQKVERVISMNESSNLYDLHLSIQLSLGWSASSPHFFECRGVLFKQSPSFIMRNGNNPFPVFKDENKSTLRDLNLSQNSRIFYQYATSGPSLWEFVITVRGKNWEEGTNTRPYIVYGCGASPPEILEGVQGLSAFLNDSLKETNYPWLQKQYEGFYNSTYFDDELYKDLVVNMETFKYLLKENS